MYHVMVLLALLPCQTRHSVRGSDPPAGEPKHSKSVAKPEGQKLRPRVAFPKIPASIPTDVAWRAALDIWDEGPEVFSGYGFGRKRRDLDLAHAEINRRFRQVARRHGLTDSQLDWVANHLCNRDLLCDYLGLSI